MKQLSRFVKLSWKRSTLLAKPADFICRETVHALRYKSTLYIRYCWLAFVKMATKECRISQQCHSDFSSGMVEFYGIELVSLLQNSMRILEDMYCHGIMALLWLSAFLCLFASYLWYDQPLSHDNALPLMPYCLKSVYPFDKHHIPMISC